MSKRLKVTAEDTNPSMVYDVVATIRQYPDCTYQGIARILDEPAYDVYKAIRYAEDKGYIHGHGGFYVRNGSGGARMWLFDKLAPYPYDYMNGKRHAIKVYRGVRGKPQFTIGGQYRNGQTWSKLVKMEGPPVMTEYGEKTTDYQTPEPARWFGPRIKYEVVGLFDSIEDAERWIRRDKKRIGAKVDPYYYHVRVLVPSSVICPRGSE